MGGRGYKLPGTVISEHGNWPHVNPKDLFRMSLLNKNREGGFDKEFIEKMFGPMPTGKLTMSRVKSPSFLKRAK